MSAEAVAVTVTVPSSGAPDDLVGHDAVDALEGLHHVVEHRLPVLGAVGRDLGRGGRLRAVQLDGRVEVGPRAVRPVVGVAARAVPVVALGVPEARRRAAVLVGLREAVRGEGRAVRNRLAPAAGPAGPRRPEDRLVGRRGGRVVPDRVEDDLALVEGDGEGEALLRVVRGGRLGEVADRLRFLLRPRGRRVRAGRAPEVPVQVDVVGCCSACCARCRRGSPSG